MASKESVCVTSAIFTPRLPFWSSLVGPLKFTPVVEGRRRGYTFEGTIALDRLLAGVVVLPTKVASPTSLATAVPPIGGLLPRAA